MILSFELTMPNSGSWNGRWSGASYAYYKHRTVSKKDGTEILGESGSKSWYYNFGDGWGANVSVQQVSSAEKNKRTRVSKGFAGYEWMIDEILKYGRILTLEERKSLVDFKEAII